MHGESSRWVVPDTPAGRRRRLRRAVRILVIDDADRILLFQDTDPGVPGVHWWITPGGGIDDGESAAAAAVRELAEETGLIAAEHDLLGPVATRTVIHGFSDRILDQQETFFLLRADAFEVDITNHTQDEQLTLLSHRWWSAADLAGTNENIWPASILDIRALLDTPQRWPVDLGVVEESSVPA